MLAHHEAEAVTQAQPYGGSREVAQTLMDAVERAGSPWALVPAVALAGRDLVREGTQTWPLVLPDGEVLGVLVREPGPGHHDELIIVLLRTFASLVSAELAAAEAARRAKEAEQEARVDALTGLLNRRAWEDAVAAESARMRRHEGRATVLVVDIDGLKEANDTGGHLAGDLLIRSTAAAIRGAVRDEDVVARIGGDEFAVLAVEAHGPEAEDAVLARVRAALAAADVTASVGAAVVEPGVTFDDAFAQADRAMYEAKRARKTATG